MSFIPCFNRRLVIMVDGAGRKWGEHRLPQN